MNKFFAIKILSLISLVIVLALVLFFTCFQRVPIDRVGVVTDQFGGGIEQRDYPSGYVFVIPFKHKLELMDPTYQLLTARDGDALRLRSSDGFQTEVDITVVYRIKPGEAHKAIARHGPGQKFREKLKTIAEKYIWEVLTELVTEDFYDAEKRVAQSELAAQLMREQLDDEYIEVADVLIRDIRYDQKYEELLLKQQLLNQEKLYYDAKKRLEEEKQITELIQRETENLVIEIQETQKKEIRELVASTDAEIAKIKIDAQKYAETQIAESSREARQMIAEGELAMTKAKAEGEKAINAAYRMSGGELLIARRMIENIQFGDIEINTNQTNPFDVRQMLRMLGIDPSDYDGTPATPAAAAAADSPSGG